MERMKPKKLNVADIRNIIRLEENEINGPTYKDYQTETSKHCRYQKFSERFGNQAYY